MQYGTNNEVRVVARETCMYCTKDKRSDGIHCGIQSYSLGRTAG